MPFVGCKVHLMDGLNDRLESQWIVNLKERATKEHLPRYGETRKFVQFLNGATHGVEELLAGKTVEMPPLTQTGVTFARAPKINKIEGNQMVMEEAFAYEAASKD